MCPNTAHLAQRGMTNFTDSGFVQMDEKSTKMTNVRFSLEDALYVFEDIFTA